MGNPARAVTPPPTPAAIKQALLGIEGIVEVRAAEDQVYVIRRGVDDASDDQIIRAFIGLDFDDFHLVPQNMAGAIPDGVRVL